MQKRVEFRPATNGWLIYVDSEYVGFALTLARAAAKVGLR